MGKRRFTIEIYNHFEWFIEIEGEDDFRDYPYFGGDIDYGFAKSKSTKDGKIAYLFDIVVREDDIEYAKDDERFLEVCEFTHELNSFTCNFCDALEYIKKVCEDE